ncbi:Protein dehydration-induced 19, C-terminal [Dillenia turbinata]|uniref:Protein dehydration-induced 19, C-terminal n=1 Tax=Dillenia turbinata TaxID=194707 RepID=A0AAN8ZE52_9MAGN
MEDFLDSRFSVPPPAKLLCPDDQCLEFEDIEEDDDYDDESEDPIPEFSCPFCWEHFDMLGLCCHVDEAHPVDAKSGFVYDEYILKSLTKSYIRRNIRLRNGESVSALSLSRKGFLKGHAERSSPVISSSNPSQDQLLSSLIYQLSTTDKLGTLQPSSSTAESPVESSDKSIIEKNVFLYPLTKEDHEKAQRCEFVQGLMMSMILDAWL